MKHFSKSQPIGCEELQWLKVGFAWNIIREKNSSTREFPRPPRIFPRDPERRHSVDKANVDSSECSVRNTCDPYSEIAPVTGSSKKCFA